MPPRRASVDAGRGPPRTLGRLGERTVAVAGWGVTGAAVRQDGAVITRPPAGTIPDEPGSYQFKDAHGRVIYVGKAK